MARCTLASTSLLRQGLVVLVLPQQLPVVAAAVVAEAECLMTAAPVVVVAPFPMVEGEEGEHQMVEQVGVAFLVVAAAAAAHSVGLAVEGEVACPVEVAEEAGRQQLVAAAVAGASLRASGPHA